MAASLERELAAWLETVAADADVADTLRAPRSTIVPRDAPGSDAERRLRAVLDQLGGPSAIGALRPGKTLGQGGMGIVRVAEQVALGRQVAVKTLRADRRDAGAAMDLLREAWVTGALEHPNIVPVHYLGLDDDGQPMLVLKRIEGTAWSDLVADAAVVRARFGAELLDWNLRILDRVLDALRFAHSRGVLHRDVKPSNVMIGEFGEVYLLDWGLAVSLRDDPAGRLPRAGDAADMAGTPCYMAPEMLGRGGPPLSERTDVYLAGAVLFEILAGRPPHDGDTALAVVTSIARSRPDLPAGAPGELARICARAMAADPADRHASIDALQHELHGYLAHRGSARLAAIAHDRLVELGRVIARPADDPGRRREDISRLFGACRFGFQEALAAWPDNEGARAGLVRATTIVAEHELAADDPAAAVRLLSELDDPPAELLARARAAVAARARRDEELARIGRQHDQRVGTRTRMFLAAVLGTIFTVGPVVGTTINDRLLGEREPVHWMVWSGALLALILALAYWARDTLRQTVVNRRVVATGVFIFVSQIVWFAAAWLLGLPMTIAELGVMLLWFAIASMTAIAIEPRLAPTAVGNAITLLAAARWPEHRVVLMSATNLVFTINAVIVWWPASLRYTPEERARRAEARRRA